MTNYESVEPDKVKDIFAEAFAVNKETGEVLKCFKLPCRLCLFRGDGCGDARRKWLDQPVLDPEKNIDWSKVPVDTPVVVWNNDWEYIKGHFYKKDNHYFIFSNGQTSYTNKDGLRIGYCHCKLANLEDIKKYRK